MGPLRRAATPRAAVIRPLKNTLPNLRALSISLGSCGAGAGPYGSPALRPRRLFRRPPAPTAASLASSAHAHRMLLASSLRSLTRRPPLPACAQLAAMSMSDEEAVMKLKMENDALEQEIMALTKKSSASELTYEICSEDSYS